MLTAFRLEGQLAFKHAIVVVADELHRVIQRLRQLYPEVEFKHGGIAVPDYIYTSPLHHMIFKWSLRAPGLPDAENEGLVKLYPADAAAIAAAAPKVLESMDIQDYNFDALVVSNVSSYLSASWYQFSFTQKTIGQMAEPKVEYFHARESKREPVMEVAQKFVIADLSSVGAFVREREAMYEQRRGYGKRLMSGNSKLILRLSSSSDDDVHEFGRGMHEFLEKSRFDPASLMTTVYREEGEDWMWAPALWLAGHMKDFVDSGIPLGCYYKHPVCKELKECVRREALGELIICEDVVIPEETMRERIEKGGKGGWWDIYMDFIFPWAEELLNEAEARLWLLYCRPSTATLAPPSKSKSLCEHAIVPISDTDFGILTDYLHITNRVVTAVAEYWLGGSTSLAMLGVPVSWIGTEDSLKILFWAVSRVIGLDNFKKLTKFVEDEEDLEIV